MEEIENLIEKLKEIVRDEMVWRMDMWEAADKRNGPSCTEENLKESIAILDKFGSDSRIVKRRTFSNEVEIKITNKLRKFKKSAKETIKEEERLKKLLKRIDVLKDLDEADTTTRRQFVELLDILKKGKKDVE